MSARPALALLSVLLGGCLGPLVEMQETPPPDLVVGFTWSPEAPRVGQPVTFDAIITSAYEGDALVRLAWRFGDGDATMDHAPHHIYTAPGDYEVKLQVETALAGVASGTHTIHVAPGLGASPPTAAGPAYPTPATDLPFLEPLEPPTISSAVMGNVVTFSFHAGYEPDEILWAFGDGATSKEAEPRHTYLSVGTFLVGLTVAFGDQQATGTTEVVVEAVDPQPRVVVGVSDSGINPYHEVYYRPEATAHPCTYLAGYEDCSIPALELSVGPDNGTYQERLAKDRAVWDSVRTMQWYWIPRTNIIAAHCPAPYTGDARDVSEYTDPICILDDTQTHGTQTTSSVLSEVPEAWLVFNEGSAASYLADAPVEVDIESNSWGSLAPLYGGYTNTAGVRVCYDDADTPTGIKLRSAGNNGPVPNMGDCSRNGYRSYSVSGGYPQDQHGYLSGSAPDFASYWCRPAADPFHVSAMLASVCGTSFAAPTAAGTAAAALLRIREELGYVRGSTPDHVAPGITHDDFVAGLVWAATFDPSTRDGFPANNLASYPTGATPWAFWGWGWLHREQASAVADCVLGRECVDNKSAEAWTFNEVRRGFAAG